MDDASVLEKLSGIKSDLVKGQEMIANIHYQRQIDSYSHLKGVVMEDKESKPYLLMHLIFGASAFATTKTAESPQLTQACLHYSPTLDLTQVRHMENAFCSH